MWPFIFKHHFGARWASPILVGVLLQDKFHGLALGRWRDTVITLLVIALVVAGLTWEPIWTKIAWNVRSKRTKLGLSALSAVVVLGLVAADVFLTPEAAIRENATIATLFFASDVKPVITGWITHSATCGLSSIDPDRRGAYACGAAGLALPLEPCFVTPDADAPVSCIGTPWTNTGKKDQVAAIGVMNPTIQDVTVAHPEDWSRPWALELAGGYECVQGSKRYYVLDQGTTKNVPPDVYYTCFTPHDDVTGWVVDDYPKPSADPNPDHHVKSYVQFQRKGTGPEGTVTVFVRRAWK